MNESPPTPDLTGCRVSVTHSGEGAQRLIRTFCAWHATVHHVPLIGFELRPDVPLTALSGEPRDAVEWAVLTSPQGVAALVHALHGRELPRGVVGAGLKWAAVGPSTAQAMQRAGLPVDFMPSQATGRALGQELPLQGRGRVLHLTSDQSKDDLAEALRARPGYGERFHYERLVLYRTLARQPTDGETALLLGSHAVTLASSSAAQQFARLGGQAVPVVVLGRQTAQTARQLGFRSVVIAQSPDLNALERAVLRVLSERPQA